ncbi:hypothetical protein ACFL2R_01290 [Patescibacteria group bacterium]
MKKYLLLFALTFIVATLIVILSEIFDIRETESGRSVMIQDDKRELVKKVAKKVSGVIYKEATEHNPEGDMLPDEIDDIIKNEIKERF